MPRKMPASLVEEDIEHHLELLTDWITVHDRIPSFTDRRFLLSFLHTCKFDQEVTRKRIKRYWKSRKNGIMKVMNGVDPFSPEIMKILRGSNAVYLPLPGVDKDGRPVLLAKWDQLDISGKSYTFDEWFCAITVLFDAMCMLNDDAMQNGVTFLMDANQVSLKHLKFFGFGNSMKQFDVMQKGYPIRIKKVHYVNNNAAIDVFFNTVKVVISSKLSERIKLHGYSLVPVYEHIGMEKLPEDYLPDDYEGACVGKFDQIMEKFIQDVILKPDNLMTLQRLYSCTVQGSMPNGVSRAQDVDLLNDSETENDDLESQINDLKL